MKKRKGGKEVQVIHDEASGITIEIIYDKKTKEKKYLFHGINEEDSEQLAEKLITFLKQKKIEPYL